MALNIGIYSGGDPSTIGNLLTDIKAGTYTTVILWAAHIDTSGDIAMNDDPVAAGGKFQTSAQAWANQVIALKTNSTINRVELSIGGDQTSFANIQTLINKYGVSSSNPLYGNLEVLKSTLNLDAINYDDENVYDINSSTALASMCVTLGMKVTICPFTEQSYWIELVNAINKANPGSADAVYLQCYDGGNSNNPVKWNTAFAKTGLAIAPGLWATHFTGNPQTCTTTTSADQAQQQMAAWAAKASKAGASLAGGWMFCGTDMLNCPGGGTPADYSNAIIKGLGSGE